MANEDQVLDDLEVAFEALMVGASPAQLFELGEGIGVPNFTDDMRKSTKMKAIRSYIYKSRGEDTAEQLKYMRDLNHTLQQFREEPKVHDSTTADGLRRQRSRDEEERTLFGQQQSDFPSDQGLPQTSPSHRRDEVDAGREMFSLIRALADANIAQRRQLKIVGVIGDAKDSRAIGFINLMSQVQDAKTSKYKDDEIAIAIKKSISASSNLRTYFDAAKKMDLSEMMGMLRDFYQEKSASELFAELGQLCQNSQEKSTDFLLRAMQIRQRTTAAATAENDLYSSRLVQSTFVRAVKTGLREESIRAQLAPHLVPGKPVEDSVLLHETNTAELEHEEKTRKLKLTQKKVTIAQATTSAPSFDEALKPLMEGLTTLQKQFSDMQSRSSPATGSSPATRSSPATGYQRYAPQNTSDDTDGQSSNRRISQSARWRCRRCQRDGLKQCWHCFSCGESGHKAQECNRPKN